MPRSILDDMDQSALEALQREAFLQGAWVMLAYLIAFYAAKRSR